jgi:regulatory protein
MPGAKPRKLDREALMDYALKTLAGRAQSLGELRDKLRRRALEPSDVDTVLAKLQESNFVNDRRFADSYANARLDNQGFGKMRVLRDLRQRRVTSQVAEKAVEQAFEGVDEVQLIERYLERKYRSVDLAQFLSEEKNLASAYRRLRTAGFGSSNSIRVLKRYASRAEELEGEEERSSSDESEA